MTLLEVCEPLFLYVCRLNRAGRKGANMPYREVRDEVTRLLDRIADTCRDSRELSADHERLELALVFFVDSMIAESGLPIAREWNGDRLAYERGERAGDEKFFDILDETLRDNSKAALERLAVLYTCLGLGFEGFYVGDNAYLAGKLEECRSRLRGRLGEGRGRICPEAYEHTDRRRLFEPVTTRLGLIAVVTAGLLVTLVAVDFGLYRSSVRDIKGALNGIVRSDWNTPTAVDPPSRPADGEGEGEETS